jgi:hypothetical protein
LPDILSTIENVALSAGLGLVGLAGIERRPNRLERRPQPRERSSRFVVVPFPGLPSGP